MKLWLLGLFTITTLQAIRLGGEEVRTRKQVFEFVANFLNRNRGRCLQGCGRTLRKGQVNFCSGLCRNLYDIQTWGEGRDQNDLTVQLKASLAEVEKGNL